MTTETSRRKGRKGLIAAVITAGVAALAALVALVLALSGILTVPGISQSSGELVLQGADELGLDPFSSEGLAEPTLGAAPTSAAMPATTAAVAQVSGGATGLYGGTTDNGQCDPGKLVAFLGANTDKAQAWVAALNADPNLRWGSGQPLTVADIPAYVADLTSLVLLTDTVVTNHGFVNGQPTPFQSVLQAGTAVLVDRFGVPRSRCMCGNPLIPPAPVAATPTVTGTPWNGFSLTNITVVVNVVTPVAAFAVVPYPTGGTPITVPAGQCVPGTPCPSPWTGAPVPTTAPSTPAPSGTATPAPTNTPAPQPTAAPVPDPSTIVPPTTQECSPGTQDATTQHDLRITNNRSVDVDVFWFRVAAEGCAPSYVTTIPAGGIYPDAWSNAGIIWVVTEHGTGNVIDRIEMTGAFDWTIN